MGEQVEERINKIEIEVSEIKTKQKMTEVNIQQIRSSINTSNELITDLRILCERIQATNENQNKTLENQNRILDELKVSREKDKEKQSNYVFWFITTVGGILVTALLGLIMI